MKHFVPPTDTHVLTCADRARMGFDRLAEAFGVPAAKAAALHPDLDINDTSMCMVALASGTHSYSAGCVILGISRDGIEAVLLGFNTVAIDAHSSEFGAETRNLRKAFRDIAYAL